MRSLRPFLGSLLSAVLLASTASLAHAAGEIATRVSITPLESLTVGAEASVLVTLAQENGTAVVDEPIALTIDGDSRPRRWTDAAGVATFNLPRDLLPGQHEIVATYAGRTNAYLGASARTVVDIVPYELAIETVPPLPGMVFEIDGTRFEAGADGVARVGLDRLGEHTVQALPSEYRHPGELVEFSRWSNETFGPTITIRAPLEVSLQAGFDVSYQASLSFMDTKGNWVDEERIEEVTLRNSIGAEIKLPDGRSRWYKAVRTIRRPAGLDTVPIRYTVEDVLVDGVNVVNVGQQRFDVEPGDSWPIELLLYSVSMVPNDALFGFPLGEAVILTYPSGATARIEAVDGKFAASGLARGLYRVQLADAPGWSPVTPIALSRDQEVRVRVITYLDIAVVVIVGLGLALGLLHVGRPHLAPAAMAGAKEVVAVTRNPRTIGALLARRGAAAKGAAGVAPAVMQARPFDFQAVEQANAVRDDAPFGSPSQRTLPEGAVPIAQVIRTTLGSPLPASLAEASALPPPAPSLSPQRPAVVAPTPLVLAPSMAVADARTTRDAQPAPPAALPLAAAPQEKGPSPAPGADGQRQPRRVRSTDSAAAAREPSKKARRAKAAHSGPATAADEVVSKKKRGRAPKALAAASSAPSSGKGPRATKAPRRSASEEEASARGEPTAVEPTLSAAEAHALAQPAASPRKHRRATTDKADVNAPKAPATKAASAKAATAKRGSKAPSAKATATKATAAKRASKAPATKAATAKAATAKRASKTPSAKATATKATAAKRASKTPSAKATAKATAAKRASKAPATKAATATAAKRVSTAPAVSQLGVTPTAESSGASEILAVRDNAPPWMGPRHPGNPLAASGEPTEEVVVPEGTSGPSALKPVDVPAVPTATRAGDVVRVLASVGSPLPGRFASSDAPISPRSSDTDCTGCGATLKPGARFCRRCGRATAMGEREREGLS